MMKDSMICHFDAKGRLMIPASLRDKLNLGEVVELTVTRDGLLIRDPQSEPLPTEEK